MIYLKSQCEGGSRAQLYHATIQNRQGSRQSQAHRTSIGIGLVSKASRAATEDLGFSAQLSMNLQPYNSFPSVIHPEQSIHRSLSLHRCEKRSSDFGLRFL